MSLQAIWQLLRQTGVEWVEDKAATLGAGLAFYSVLSLAPLLVITIAIAGAVFGEEAARGEIVAQIEHLVGPSGAMAIQEMIIHARKPQAGAWATALGIAILLVGASGVFGALQDALNTIWNVRPKSGRGLTGLIRDRFLSFVMVLGTGFLLLVSLVLSAALAALGDLLDNLLPGRQAIYMAMTVALSFGVFTLLFALIFKVLPDVKIAWGDVWIGAMLTALLFTVGKFLLGLYLGRASVGSAYGAAGSLVVLLVWVYYSAQILFFGAEFTQVYAKQRGSAIVPTENAVRIQGSMHEDVEMTRTLRARQRVSPKTRQPGNPLP